MKNHHFPILLCSFILMIWAGQVFAQIPTIKNPRTGAEVKLGPIPKVVEVVRIPVVTPISTAQINLQSGGIRTIKLYKSPLSQAFNLNKGNPTNAPSPDPAYTCVNTPVNASTGNFDLANFAPTDFIFPGNIVDGMTIPSGEYRQITASRNPIAIAISITNGGVAPISEVVQQPNVASVREAVNRLTAGANFSQGVELGETRVQTVYSSEDVSLAMDIHARNLLSSLSSSVTSTSDANKLTVVKIIKQRYYSVDVVPPANQQDFFSDPATNISPNWAYLSSVKYGRIGVMVMTFESKTREINASLEGKIQGLIGSVSGSIDAELSTNFKSMTIRTFQFGGAPMNIAGGGVASLAAAQNVFRQFDNWTKLPVNNPQPIGYTLRFVKYDNGGPSVASLQSTLQYTLKRCITRQPRYEVTLKEIKCLGADDGDGGTGEDIYCLLTSKAFKGNNAQFNALFNQPEVVLHIKDCSTRSIASGASYSVPNGTRTYDIPGDDLDARVIIGGDIDEDDNCGIGVGSDDEYNDENGARTQKTIFFKDISTTPQTVLFDHKSGGSHIQQVWVLKKTYQ